MSEKKLPPHGAQRHDCHCGSHQPPQLLDRQRLVNSLQLKGVIAATYSLDLEWMQDTWPQLAGRQSHVPTLILHGQRGLDERLECGNGNGLARSNTNARNASVNDNKNDDADIDSIGSLEESWEDRDARASRANPQPNNAKQRPIEISRARDASSDIFQSSKNLHVTEVRTASKRRVSTSVTSEKQATSTKSKLETKRGVFHPKFMLLFETSGDVVVMVSTANLTGTSTVEGCWLQRFYSRRRPKDDTVSRSKLTRPTIWRKHGGNDFGQALTHFLKTVSKMSKATDIDVAKFMQQHLAINLTRFQYEYRFENAEVDLVAVMPGDYDVDHSMTQQGASKWKSIGRQRLGSLLINSINASSDGKRGHDTLIAQSTSLGSNWTRQQMAKLARSLLGANEHNDDDQMLQQINIVWPSCEYLVAKDQEKKNIKADRKRANGDSNGDSNKNSGDPNNFVPTLIDPTKIQNTGTAFLSTNSFNSCEESCILRLAHYVDCEPAQIDSALPHIKSMTRLCSEETSRQLQQQYGDAKEHISWFLLTSACMSYGAQGIVSQEKYSDSEKVSYANFELGVLFQSRLYHGDEIADSRLYCFNPTKCACHSAGDDSSRLIHLPIPFSLRPAMYTSDSEASLFNATPYFHEVSEGTQCIGNMMLTPYARHMASAQLQAQRKRRK